MVKFRIYLTRFLIGWRRLAFASLLDLEGSGISLLLVVDIARSIFAEAFNFYMLWFARFESTSFVGIGGEAKNKG
ncbi:MAG TPA: hypothetical protein VMZ27_16340 [Candidatus Saccharimonadales bacterium]|nr:hypothetical protein [Candidatus Saccharimonadales bacterium]